MYEGFTDRSRKVMRLAAKKAKQRGDYHLGIHHLLMALIEDGNGLATNILKQLNVDILSVSAKAELSEPFLEGKIETDFIGCLTHTPNTKKAIEHANEVAMNFGHNYIGTEHLLLGLLNTSHPAIEILHKAGVYYKNVYEKIIELLSCAGKETPRKEEITINFYHGVLKRIMKVCDENSTDGGVKKIKKIVKRAILDGGKWNIS